MGRDQQQPPAKKKTKQLPKKTQPKNPYQTKKPKQNQKQKNPNPQHPRSTFRTMYESKYNWDLKVEGWNPLSRH